MTIRVKPAALPRNLPSVLLRRPRERRRASHFPAPSPCRAPICAASLSLSRTSATVSRAAAFLARLGSAESAAVVVACASVCMAFRTLSVRDKPAVGARVSSCARARRALLHTRALVAPTDGAA